MKNIILMIFPMLISCQTNSVDLDQLSFPINISVLEKTHKLTKNSDLAGIIFYNSTDSSLLRFSGYSFSGTLNNQDESILPTNYVSFYKSRTTDKVNAYRLEIKTTEKAKEFEQLVEKKFGKTDFYYRDQEFSYRVWNAGNKLYLFETNNTGRYNGKKFESCSLYVLAKGDQFLTNYFLAGGFQYYGDYIQVKNKPEQRTKKYTYQNFIDEQEKQDGKDSFYLKHYIK